MISFIFGVIFAALFVVAWVIFRTYWHVPLHEQKRMARGGDKTAQTLYKVAAYGASLRGFLIGCMIAFGLLALALLSASLGFWPGAIVLAVVVGVGGFVFVPGSELTHSSLWLAKKAVPVLTWSLERAQPVFDRLVHFVHQHHPVNLHTKIYEKSDLLDLLERQKKQTGSRITPDELTLLEHALTFGDKLVSDVLVPKRVVKSVSVSDPISPVLMDELSKSGHSRFPVYEGKKDNIVSILYLHDLITTKHTGTVGSVNKHKPIYIHEDFTLARALQAFLKTKRHLFLVVNSFEEYVGILTIEDVLEQIIGKPIVDEFDQYEDLRAVAELAAKKDHTEHTEPLPEPPSVEKGKE